MQIEFQNCQIDLANTKIEYNSSIRGDVRTISTILFLANWMGYSLDSAGRRADGPVRHWRG